MVPNLNGPGKCFNILLTEWIFAGISVIESSQKVYLNFQTGLFVNEIMSVK